MSEYRYVNDGDLTRHPLSEAWGDMPEEALLELAEDIKQNGQKDTVVLFEGMVLDGWHRCQGCQIAGIEIRVRDFPEDKDARAYVISKNAHRRSQTASQRAAAVVKCHEWMPRGRPSEIKSAPGSDLSSTAEMARQAGTSSRTIEHAKAAEEAGLGDAVRDGKISAKEGAQGKKNQIGHKSDPTTKKSKPPTPLEKAQTKIGTLKAELADRDTKIEELTDHLESYLAAAGDDNDQQVKFAQLYEQIRVLKSQVNEHMAVADQFKRECKALRKRLGIT